MHRILVLLGVSASLLFGCSLRVGTRSDPGRLDVSGLAGGYVSVNGIRPYDGTIVAVDIFRKSSRSDEFEVASVEVWPVLALGVGLVGARAQLGPLDAGFGVLGYRPQAPRWENEGEALEPDREGAPEGEAGP
ncbi:MAG: hypothetical protein ACUVYA_09085 [Planctomycetota bacterium]